MITCVSGVWSSYLNWFLHVKALPVLDLLHLVLKTSSHCCLATSRYSVTGSSQHSSTSLFSHLVSSTRSNTVGLGYVFALHHRRLKTIWYLPAWNERETLDAPSRNIQLCAMHSLVFGVCWDSPLMKKGMIFPGWRSSPTSWGYLGGRWVLSDVSSADAAASTEQTVHRQCSWSQTLSLTLLSFALLIRLFNVQLPQRCVPRERLANNSWHDSWHRSYLQYKTNYFTLSCLKDQCVF